jgi:hypothetical protein
MSDIIDINVSKIVETIDIVANFEHPNIEITAIESIDNVEINAVPNVVQVNINTVIGSGAEWGEIDGTLSDQTDLQDALDLKANTSELGAVAFSNDYNDLDNLPTIPEAVTKTSDLINDGEDGVNPFITLEDIPPIDISTLVPYTGATQDVDLGENGISAGFFKFDTTPTDIPEVQGAMFWDEDDNTVDVILNGYRMKIGEDTFYPVKNQSGSTITKGTNVKFAGTVGSSGRLLILPFLANGTDPSYVYMGVTAEDIANGEDGKVLWFGRLRGLNTNAFNEGDILYASTTSAGGFQTTIPTGNNNLVQVAAVIKKSVNQGVIFIRPQIEPLLFKPENVANKSVNLTSPDNTKYPTTQAVVDGLSTKQNTLTNPVTGTGANGQVSFWNGTNSQTGDNGFFWDNTNKRLGIGTNVPTARFQIEGINSLNTIFTKNHSGFQAFVVNNQGNTSIGLNAVSTAMLNVKGVGNTSTSFALGVVNASSTDIFNVRNDGNIGISTTSPSARLDVRAQGALSTDIAFRVRNSANTANLIQVNGLGGVEINSTTQGFLPPRMTTTQKNAIVSPASGLVIYDTTLNKLCVRGASAWETITSI